MRFGIEQMQPAFLFQQARGLLSTGQPLDPSKLNVDVATQVERLADLGFRLIELNPDLTIFFPHCYDLPAIERLRQLKEQRQLQYTLHLPLWSIEPSTPVRQVREGSVDVLVDALVRFAPLEPEVRVLHATGALAAEFSHMLVLEPMRPMVLGLFIAQARRSIEQILERTGLTSRQLAIETIIFPFDLTLRLAEELDLSMCLDTGHVLAGYTSGVTLSEAFERTLPRLTEVHLHDAYRRTSLQRGVEFADHLPLGTGDLPLANLLDRLEQAKFTGPIILELTVEQAQTSLAAIRAVRPGMLPETV